MKPIKAFEGAGYTLHRAESRALAEIINEAGEATLAELLDTSNADYQTKLQDAILRAAEIIQKLRKTPRKKLGGV